MLYSINYTSEKKQLADEIRCPYNKLGYLFNFIKEHPDKRYNIITDALGIQRTIEQIDILRDLDVDYTIECVNVTITRQLINKGYKAYVRFPVTDWETFRNLQSLDVSDIYIDGPLGFQAERLREGKKNTKLRASPTLSPNATTSSQLAVTSFFVRPEDICLYEGIFDIIEFKTQIQDREDTLLSIYKRGTFNYNINELINGLPQINNMLIPKDFGQTRANCKQLCQTPTYQCHYCEGTFSIIDSSIKLINMGRKD